MHVLGEALVGVPVVAVEVLGRDIRTSRQPPPQRLYRLKDQAEKVNAASRVAVKTFGNPGVALQLPLDTFAIVSWTCKYEKVSRPCPRVPLVLHFGT